MKTNWLPSDANGASLVLRLTLGGIVLAHGWQKLGGGYAPFIAYFTGPEGLHLPHALGLLVIGIEVLGSLALMAGLATRLNAALLFGLFVGIVATVHWPAGFWMNWFGQLDKGQEGYEYHLLALAMSAAVGLLGGGRWSLDGRRTARRAPVPASAPQPESLAA